MTGYIDLTGCKASVREFYFDNLHIPITRGVHQRDFDADIANCSPEFIARCGWRSLLEKRRQYKRGMSIDSQLMPLGFDLVQLPEGARLVYVA